MINRRDFHKTIATLFGAAAIPTVVLDTIIPALPPSELSGFWGVQRLLINTSFDVTSVFELGTIEAIDEIRTEVSIETDLCVLSGDEPDFAKEITLNFKGTNKEWIVHRKTNDPPTKKVWWNSGYLSCNKRQPSYYCSSDMDIFHAGTDKIANVTKMLPEKFYDIHIYYSECADFSFDSREKAEYKIVLSNHQLQRVQWDKLPDPKQFTRLIRRP